VGVLTALLTIPLGLLAFQQAPAPANPQQDLVLFLAPAAKSGVDVHALLDAVATYTRDLRVRVQLVRTDELAAGAGARGAAAGLVRARAARLAFWCAPGTEAGSVVMYTVDSRGTMRRDVVDGPGSGAAELHRAVGLKVRALLAGEAAPEAAEIARVAAPPGEHERDSGRERERPQAVGSAPRGPSVAPAAPTPPPAVTPPVVPSRAVAAATLPGGPPPAPETTETSSPPAPLPAAVDSAAPAATLRAPPRAPADSATPTFRWRGVFASAGYGMAFASGNAPLRQGLTLHGTAGLAWPVELEVGAGWAPSAQRTVAAGTIAVRDIPMRLGVRVVHRGQRLLAGIGAFGAVHVLSASASSAAGREDETTAAGGVGIEAVGRGALGGGLSWEVRLWAERLIPRTRFLIGGEPVLDPGAVTLGLGAGVAFPTR
jgi:hypothetical protein